MDFLGFVLLQNKLKPETVPILAELRRACIRSVMVTGGHILSATPPPELNTGKLVATIIASPLQSWFGICKGGGRC